MKRVGNNTARSIIKVENTFVKETEHEGSYGLHSDDRTGARGQKADGETRVR